MKSSRTTALLVVSALALAACLGAPNRESHERSEAVGNETRGTQLAAVQHGNWHEAATGHLAAGEIPRDALDTMERESAPGGHFRGQTPEQGPAAAPAMPSAAPTVAPSASPPPASSSPPPPSGRRARGRAPR